MPIKTVVDYKFCDFFLLSCIFGKSKENIAKMQCLGNYHLISDENKTIMTNIYPLT